jgi:hypothetical protein
MNTNNNILSSIVLYNEKKFVITIYQKNYILLEYLEYMKTYTQMFQYNVFRVHYDSKFY